MSDRLQAAAHFLYSQQAAARLHLAAALEFLYAQVIGLAVGAGGRSGASV